MIEMDSCTNSLRVGQINLQKSKAGSAELNRRSYQIALVTEPYVYKGNVKLLDSRAGTVTARPNISPRACVRCSVDHWPVVRFTDRDIATIVTRVDNKDVYFSSVYLDIEKDVVYEPMKALVTFCNSRGLPLVLGLDSNAHSTAWGADEDNERGVQLEAFFISVGLTVVNVGSVRTFASTRASSNIDVTVANQATRDMTLADWKVRLDESFSDHRYIEFTCGKYEPTGEESRDLRKADWNCFREQLENSRERTEMEELTLWDAYWLLEGEDGLVRASEIFMNETTTALDAACPKSKVARRKPNSWWNEDLERSRKAIRSLARKRHRNEFRKWQYNEARQQHTKLIDKAKRRSWRAFCSNAESAKDVSQIIRSLTAKPARVVGLLQHEERRTETPEEAIDLLMKVHFPGSTTAGPRCENETQEALEGELLDYMTAKVVREAMRSFGPKKAPGPDGFHPMVLQNLSDSSVEIMTKMYRASLRRGVIPMAWREMKVIFLPKDGKDDYSSPKAYRPITLSSFVLKTVERVVLWYLLERVISMPLPNQHAYTAGLSTETALSTFVDAVEKAIHRGQYVLAVSLDCSGAFDRISFKSAEDALERHNVPDMITRWYSTLLRNRRVTAELQGATKTVVPGRGTPQGGILSPLVWNLIIDSLLRNFSNGPVKAIGYADDTLLYVTGVDPVVMASFMQEALDHTMNWGQENGLSFNPTKTTTVLFTRSRRRVREPKLLMDGKPLEYSDDMKYLGVLIQKRLSWTGHAKERSQKAGKLLNMVRSIIGSNWGLDPDKILWTHTAIARPKVGYAAMVWATGVGDTASKKLELIQRKTLLGVSASMRSTPTTAMEAIIGLPPLDLFLKGEALKARLRTRKLMQDTWDGVGHTVNKSVAKGHRKLLDDILKQIVDLDAIEDRPNGRSMVEWRKLVENSLEMFTDGAWHDGYMGFGWALYDGPSMVAAGSGHAGAGSPYRAELQGISDALLWLISNPERLKDRNLRLISDSKSAVEALKAPKIKDAKTQEILDEAMMLMTLGDIELKWVRKDEDERSNLPDALAKRASKGEHTNGIVEGKLAGRYHARDKNTNCTTVMQKEAKGLVNQHMAIQWQKRWDRKAPPTTKQIFPFVNTGGIKRLRSCSRKQLNDLFQFGTGHGLFGGHLKHWLQIDETCQLCLEGDETSAHLLWECPALAWWRETSTADDAVGKILELAKLKPVAEMLQENGKRIGRR